MRLTTVAGMACILAAVVRVATASYPDEANELTPEQQRAAYDELASAEAAMREHGVTNFPADRWSQDDDFHASERARVFEYAQRLHLRPQEVFRAIDVGVRAHWPAPDGGMAPRATVPVCRPRPVD